MSLDILIAENGSGGDIEVVADDIVLIETLWQQVYLQLFGGNVEASTEDINPDAIERSDYWGNELFYSEKVKKQFNSETERVLDQVALNSSGRIDIERAVQNDLQDLSDLANIAVDAVIESTNRIRVDITMVRPDNTEDVVLQFIWDNAASEIIIERII